MLDAAGVGYESLKPRVDEEDLKRGLMSADDIAMTLARAKALSIPGEWVIGSDSVVSVNGRIFNKPLNQEDAAEHLRFFSGKTMILTSAVALAHAGTIEWSYHDRAVLNVRHLTEGFIASYLDAEWPDVGYCVGVFRMEGRGVQLFDSVDGNHFTILGMPLIPLLGALRERGLVRA